MTDVDTGTAARKSRKGRSETRTDDGKEHLRLWVRLLACAHTAEQRVKGRIKERFGINQTAFNLMSQLDRFPDGIRMGELSRRTVVTGSNVTAVIDDLERRGFVVRSPAPDDRRAIVIGLTSEGREAFAGMAPIHACWIEEIFAEFSVESQADLVSRLDELKEAMRATLSTSL
ncbi:MarR family winged helix-turn-helix transcriptional regulator [Microbaculum sp. FT89]|uniref:MarR family winged helix-turn-helix transcriptional regulator n=1 Tax=Microbaculum sp. FT89 TaxID=3447298 RepID=UPI003F52B317